MTVIGKQRAKIFLNCPSYRGFFSNDHKTVRCPSYGGVRFIESFIIVNSILKRLCLRKASGFMEVSVLQRCLLAES